MTTPGNSRTFASSDDRRERRSRRLWAAALCVYAVFAAADLGLHARGDVRLGQNWLAPSNLTVSFSAGLFWPFDLLAHLLLAP